MFGAMGKESKVAVGAEKDDPLVLGLTTNGKAEGKGVDSATVTVMGTVDALI